MKKNKLLTLAVITLALAGLVHCIAGTQTLNPTMTAGSNSCCGKYYAYVRMTNSAGSVWIKPPTNVVSGTLTDISGFPSPYSSYAAVTPMGGVSVCDSNTVTFSATNAPLYQLSVYVSSPTPPPTNGQPMTVQITWQ